MTLTYKKAGVDIQEIKKSQSAIGKILKSTYKTGTTKVAYGFGHYAGIVDIGGNRLLATHTDGVGTKVMIASMMKKYDTIGIDCIAMNVNDIICIGATPVSFVDYIAANQNNQAIFKKIMIGLARGAKKSGVPIVGGETAIMPDLLPEKEFSFDLAGMVAGIVTKNKMIMGNKIKSGDIIYGAKSSGIHSNGYSLARKALLSKYSLKDKIKGVGNIGDALLTPTEIYVKPVLEIISKCNIHGLAHITGGAFTKLLRLKNIGYQVENLPKPPPIMQVIEDIGVPRVEMFKTFNMGVGFCIISPSENESTIMQVFKKHKIKCQEIGKISNKTGVFVESKKIA